MGNRRLTVMAGIMALNLICSSVKTPVVTEVVMSSNSAPPSTGEPCSRRWMRGDLESVRLAGMAINVVGGLYVSANGYSR